MKLHDPKFENSLLAAVSSAVTASAHGNRDSRLKGDGIIVPRMKSVLGAILAQAAISYGLLLMLGLFHPELRTVGCQNTVMGLWFFLGSGVIRDLLLRESFHSEGSRILWMLPLPGELILRHAVQRTLWQTWPTLLRAWLACLWLAGGKPPWSLEIVGRGFLNGIGIWAVTVALAMLLAHPNVFGGAWSRVASKVYRAGMGMLLALLFSTSERWHWLPLHDWLEAASSVVLWFLPAAWISTSLTGHALWPAWISAMVTLSLVGMGAWLWWQWPKAASSAFDSLPKNAVQKATEDEDDDFTEGTDLAPEADLAGSGETAPANAQEQTSVESLRQTLTLEETETLLVGGWIQRLVHRTFSARDRAILPVLMMNPPRWTRNWFLAAKGLAAVLAFTVISRVILAHLPSLTGPFWYSLPGALFAVGCIGTAALVLFIAPLGGDISDGLSMWPAGSTMLPFQCGFPVNSRDMVRIGCKVVGVRTLTAALLALPSAWVLGWVYAGDWRTGVVAASMAARLLWLNFTLRPAVVAYRINTVVKRHGAYMAAALCTLAIVVLFLVWLFVAGALVALAAADSGQAKLPGNALILSLGLAVVTLLPNLAIAECFGWRLRHRGLDFGS